MAKCILVSAGGDIELKPINLTVNVPSGNGKSVVVTNGTLTFTSTVTSNKAEFVLTEKGTYTISCTNYISQTLVVDRRDDYTVTLVKDTVSVRVYGAVNETISIGGVSGYTNAQGYVDMELPKGTYTPTCSVSGWNTAVTIASNTTAVYCRPSNEKLIYWYGVKNSNYTFTVQGTNMTNYIQSYAFECSTVRPYVTQTNTVKVNKTGWTSINTSDTNYIKRPNDSEYVDVIYAQTSYATNSGCFMNFNYNDYNNNYSSSKGASGTSSLPLNTKATSKLSLNVSDAMDSSVTFRPGYICNLQLGISGNTNAKTYQGNIYAIYFD